MRWLTAHLLRQVREDKQEEEDDQSVLEEFEQYRMSPEVARQRLEELVNRLVLHGQTVEEDGAPLTRSPKRDEGDRKRETVVKKTQRRFVTGMKHGQVVVEVVKMEERR